MTDTFHKAAVAGKNICIVIDDIGAEPRFHHPLRERHADGIGNALAERPRRGLDAAGVAVFGMTRRPAAELPEVADLIDVDVIEAGQIEQRIEQHRTMTV